MQSKTFKILFILTLPLLLIKCSDSLITPENESEMNLESRNNSGQSSEAVPNEMLVKFKAGVSEEKKSETFAKMGAKVKEHIFTKMMEKNGAKDGIYLLSLSVNALEGISRSKAFGEIEFAEPNFVYTHQATSNDPYFLNGSLWGMSAGGNQFGCGAATAWANNKIG